MADVSHDPYLIERRRIVHNLIVLAAAAALIVRDSFALEIRRNYLPHDTRRQGNNRTLMKRMLNKQNLIKNGLERKIEDWHIFHSEKDETEKF